MDEVTVRSLDKVEDASDRARWVVVVMQVACILVFMAAWHEVPDGWTHARLRKAQAAAWYLDCNVAGHPELLSGDDGQSKIDRHDRCHFVDEVAKYQAPSSSCPREFKRSAKAPFCEAELESARQFLGDRGFTPAQAREYLKNLEASLVERTITVAVPFLGVSFDVNDLSLFASITFLLLLSLLLFNLIREEENLTMLFESLSDEELPAAYRVLSMTQVFTIPPALSAKRGMFSALVEPTWRWVARLLFLTPLIVEAFVLSNNRSTLNTGQAVSRELANVEYRLGITCFLLMIIVTASCLWGSAAISSQWRKAHGRVSKTIGDDTG